MDPKTEQSTFQAELLELFVRNVPPPVLALNGLLALLLVLLLNGLVPPLWLAGWWGLIVSVAIFNGWQLRAYRLARERADFDSRHWVGIVLLGPLLNGTAWGVGGALLYVPSAPVQSMLVLLVICGVAAGTVASQSSLPRGPYLFLIPAFLIPAVRIAFLGPGNHALITPLLLIYSGFLVFVANSNHRALLQSVRLRHHNELLLQALSESERHFRSLIENALDWVSVVKADGTLLFQSPSVEELLGWRPNELEGKNAFVSVHPDDRSALERDFKRVLAEGGVAAFDMRWRHREGRWVRVHALVRRLGDEPTLVINARDVTEQRALEADLHRAKESAETASRVKDQFLASMSHEMRTPLHAIQGMADLMRETPLTLQQREYVTSFQEAGRHLAKLVNDILDFSRMNAGAMALASDPFDLHRLLASIVALMSLEAQVKGLRLHLDVSTDVSPVRLGDATRLRQILVNLVGNAVKFTERGEVRIQVVSEGPDRLRFTVSDTGRGIPLGKQDLLFKPFSQIDASAARESGGVGLGLAISCGLVEAMGGHIGVESGPGEGSRFFFSVPCPGTRATAPSPIPLEGLAVDLPPARILVADDAELNRLVMKEFFRGTPCSLDFVQTGPEAVAACGRNAYDLVLMDIQMPDMDGWEATRAIRAVEVRERRRPVPIIALTAGVIEQDRVNAQAVGCTDFLAKPITRAQLLAHAATLLRNQSQPPRPPSALIG